MTGLHSLRILPAGAFDAVIFDLDGVVTRTAAVHAPAWKRLFDAFLAERDPGSEPFDIEADYRAYLDGKSRYDGAESFLRSREIGLARGSPDDPPARETVCGLANRENGYFHEELARAGVELYASTIELIGALKKRGIAVGLFSANRNARAVLDAAGIARLFDATLDGIEAERLGLADKPDPAVLLEALKRLGARPERAVVVVDAIAGVAAGRAGGFRLVIGVDRGHDPSRLAESGADIVVADLAEVALAPEGAGTPIEIAPLPSALERFEEIASAARGRRIALFLDFDGTLTPIAERPELARLSSEMRARITGVAEHAMVAIVSGRDLVDLKSRIGIAGVAFAGSHGFDIAGSEELGLDHQVGTEFVALLDRAEAQMRQRLGGIQGSLVERKRFSIAVHYRNVAETDMEAIERAVAQTIAAHPGLRRRPGKKVHDIQPDIDWHKGRAVLWLIDKIDLARAGALVIYIGDDETDEDAFAALGSRGIGILVAEAPRPTDARYRLKDPDEVGEFLINISKLASGASP